MGGGGGNWRSRDSGTPSSGNGGSTQQSEEAQNVSDGPESEDPCHFVEQTELDATAPEVLDDVDIGDVFPIEFRDGRVCVVDFEDRIVGSILESPVNRLEECMDQGWKYRAEILSIDGRNCEVLVTNKCFINERAMLASPDPDVLTDISEGDVLNVAVWNESLCVIDDSDRIVGPLAKAWTQILIQCIESGMEYRAEVKTINGGNCTVNVANAPFDG